MANFYISDLHLGHKNVIRFDNRPFKDVEEMYQVITDNWNRVVSSGDTVYVLGDFFWKTEKKWPERLRALAGHKVLIKGNHDLRAFTPEKAALYDEICEYKEIMDGDRHVIMCHYPIPFHKRDYDPNYWMLYGHVHTTREFQYVEQIRREIKERYVPDDGRALGNFINVGCMMPWMNYTPRSIDEIIAGDKEYHETPTRTFGEIR